MPYIEPSRRKLYDNHIGEIVAHLKNDTFSKAAGDFTYVVYKLMGVFNDKFWQRALCVGCLIMAILEMYRKSHSIYEDKKIIENGDKL